MARSTAPSRRGRGTLAAARLDRLADILGDRLYVELQRHGTAAEEAVLPHLVALAYERGLPLVATNEPFFPAREDYEAHDALIAIAEGTVIGDGNRRRLTEEHYFKTRAEMAALFADLPEAIENTVEIAMRSAWWPRARKPILPRFAESAADAETAARAEALMLREAAEAGLTRRLAAHGLAPGLVEDDYRKRPGVRARRHREDAVSGLLPDRRRLHPVGEEAGHPGRGPAAAPAPAR